MSLADYLRFVLALVFVLGLIGLFAVLLKRYGPGAGMAIARGVGRRRLSIVEVLGLDARRRLVLVRRDGVEHLLLLGLDKDLVVETGIPAPDPAEPAENQPRPEPGGFSAVLARALGPGTQAPPPGQGPGGRTTT